MSANFTSEEAQKILAGAPFVNGTSTAPVYYNVYEYNQDIWVYAERSQGSRYSILIC